VEEEDKSDLEPVTSFAETHVINKTEKSSFYPKAIQPIFMSSMFSITQCYFALGDIQNKSHLKLSLAKSRQKAKVNWKTYQLFNYGDIHYITNSFLKIYYKQPSNYPTLCITSFTIFRTIRIFLLHMIYVKMCS
jgi:hypothetical protein